MACGLGRLAPSPSSLGSGRLAAARVVSNRGSAEPCPRLKGGTLGEGDNGEGSNVGCGGCRSGTSWGILERRRRERKEGLKSGSEKNEL